MEYKKALNISAPFSADEEKPFIFISYAHADRELVFPIIKNIYQKGWYVWYDEGLEIGDNYYQTLQDHISNCSLFLLFASNKSSVSEYINKCEIPQALKEHKPILICELYGKFDYASIPCTVPTTPPETLTQELEKITSLRRTSPREARGHLIRVSLCCFSRDLEYDFEVIKNGVRLTKYKGSLDNIKVPTIYPPNSELNVVELGDTFTDNHIIKTIYLPNGIIRFSFNCFRNCKRLKDIYFPSTVLFSYTRKGNVYPLEQGFFDFPSHKLRKVNIHCAPGSPIDKGFQKSKKQGVRIVPSDHLMASEICGRNIEPYAYCSFTTEESERIAGIIRELEKSFSCKLKGSYTWSFIEPHEDRHDTYYCLDDLFMYNYTQETEDERQRDFANASCFIAFVNKAYICSDRINELFIAVKTNKKIAVYLLENCDLPKELNSLNDMHQLRFDTGTEDERIVKLSNWLSQNDCRVKSQIPDFDIIVKNTGIEILKYTGSKNHVVIENSYGGIKVTKICNGAFAYCDSILTLFIPKSVLEIEEKAFEHCENYLTVYCHENSIAHNFCVREKIPFQLL